MTASTDILGMRVDVTSVTDAVARIDAWLADQAVKRGRYVCVANVHMCMETHDSPAYRSVVNGADLVVPDGRPLVWAQRLLGSDAARHLRGEDLLHAVCAHAARRETSVGFYGATPDVLEALAARLRVEYPGLQIDLCISPPFRPLTPDEDEADVSRINDAGVGILFVGLGCPKQERWMAEHRDRLGCVMLGVGAAFDFVAGRKAQAPRWMQRSGLEWSFRLASEPRRLWKRYLKHNPRFAGHFAWQWLSEQRR